jgi:anti-sigma B factor antagonist
MSMELNVRETAHAVILEATARITLGAPGPSLQSGVRELLDNGHKNIILDLGGVTFLDSSGLGQLVGCYATALSRGSEIKLLNLNSRVYD